MLCKFLSLSCRCVIITINLAEQGMCLRKGWGDVNVSPVPDKAFRGPEAQFFDGSHLFNKNQCRKVSPQYSCSPHEITHSATSDEKGRYAMRKWKRLSYHKLRNAKTFSVFPTMLHTETIIVFCVLFYKQFHASDCQSFVSVTIRSQCSSVKNDLNVAVALMTWFHSLSVSVS